MGNVPILDTPLKDRDGLPYYHTTGKPLTVRNCINVALDSGLAGEKKEPLEKRRLDQLSAKIYNGSNERLLPADVELVKKYIDEVYTSAYFSSRLIEYIDKFQAYTPEELGGGGTNEPATTLKEE